MEMVSETKLNGTEGAATAAAGATAAGAGELPPALQERPAGLPRAAYALVGWDMDTTGRRLIDEICQIAAYTPKSTYSQYIMPHGDLNPGARRRHNVRVVTVGRYRMLKDNRTHKVLKTKSEISALTDFLEWLEKEKGDASGVILVYHEPRRLSPTMLLEALTRYNLLDRFKEVVSGFADGYALAADKCQATVKSVSLRVLARVLLDAEAPAVDGALERATAAYRILEHLSQSDRAEVGAGGEGAAAASGDAAETARAWARPVHTELEALAHLKRLLERQNTFRPVFAPLLRAQRVERKRVTGLRRLLADAGLLYPQLRDAWLEDKIEGLTKQMSALNSTAKEEEIKELIEIFDCHFDPAKESKGPKPREPRYRKPSGRSSAEGAAGGEGRSESDSRSDASPSEHSPAKHSSDTGASADSSTSLPVAAVAN